MTLEKVYEPQRFEPRWAEAWIAGGYFTPPEKKQNGREVFSLVIPPPNVTGSLHIGHMLEHTEIDATIRWHRMRGDQTLWLPGQDHAGIATQMVVERALREKEGLSRHDLGREEFVRRVWQWKELYGNTIIRQMQRTGASCDWTRNRFTLDPGLSRAVRETFVRLYEKGLIYRGEYMVNWCPRCHTALSDLEVVHEDAPGNLWHIRYPVKDLPGRFVTVATTRPETMLGDTAVCVNPEDERYRDLHGRAVILPLMNREIPVIADPLADPQFGTGVVKVTPAHDPNDFEAGRRHGLPHVVVIGLDGRMTEAAGAYAGLDRFEARKRVLADLEAQGLLEKIEAYTLSAGRCQRCKTIVEPLVSTQWFCRMKPLAEPAIRAVEDGRIRIVPENYAKTYFEWMHNIRDWCVSRQLWWGHRIPAWHCAACKQTTVSREDPAQCAHCGSAQIEQDPDVLDTWFSSGLWPFSTLGWPDRTADLETYYPTTLLITGFDILFFWVARMIMLGIECTGEVPFRTVYIHGLVRDAHRQKMSKTRGNTIDPLEVIEQYGTDAVRFALLRGAAPGMDIALSEERMTSSRAFANKIWNAARFLFLQMEKVGLEQLPPGEPPRRVDKPRAIAGEAPLEDRWIRHKLNEAAARMEQAQLHYRYHEAADIVWTFLWDDFCDWYLEIKKLRVAQGVEPRAHVQTLAETFELALRLLHPLMPFLSEELWQRLVAKGAQTPESICIAPYPQPGGAADEEAARQFALLQSIVTAARALRADNKVDPGAHVEGWIESLCTDVQSVASAQQAVIDALAGGKFELNPAARPAGVRRASSDYAVGLKLSGAQIDSIRQRVEKRLAELEKVIGSSRKQLASESFVAKAPAQVVEGIRAKLAAYEKEFAEQQAVLAELGV